MHQHSSGPAARFFRKLCHLLMAAAALLVLCGPLHAQDATQDEAKTIQEIFNCLAPGLPEDWQHAMMTMDLAAAGSDVADVQYVVVRGNAADRPENFRPCDAIKPARALLDVRQRQPEERRGW